MLFVALLEMGLLSFNHSRYDNIVKDLSNKVKSLEKLAIEEEQKAEAYLASHVSAKSLASKARTTAGNIGKLLG